LSSSDVALSDVSTHAPENTSRKALWQYPSRTQDQRLATADQPWNSPMRSCRNRKSRRCIGCIRRKPLNQAQVFIPWTAIRRVCHDASHSAEAERPNPRPAHGRRVVYVANRAWGHKWRLMSTRRGGRNREAAGAENLHKVPTVPIPAHRTTRRCQFRPSVASMWDAGAAFDAPHIGPGRVASGSSQGRSSLKGIARWGQNRQRRVRLERTVDSCSTFGDCG
jgi:hypothetical protein